MYKDRFIKYIQFEKRYSQHTVAAYENDLVQFFAFLKNEYDTEDICGVDYLMIRSWLANMMQESITPESVNRKISTLKSFYKYLMKEGVIEKNPMTKIISPKKRKKLPVFVERERMNMLFDDINFGEGFRAKRDRLIMEVFYCTGMRLSELINIEDKNVDVSGCTVKVLGKRNKERIIPFDNSLMKSFIDYITCKKESVSGVDADKYLFVTEKGKKLYRRLVYRVVTNYLGQITSLAKKSPHVLRHTFATHMLNNGADINAIKELLGHANLSATQIYTHNTIDKLKNIYKQAHPKA